MQGSTNLKHTFQVHGKEYILSIRLIQQVNTKTADEIRQKVEEVFRLNKYSSWTNQYEVKKEMRKISLRRGWWLFSVITFPVADVAIKHRHLNTEELSCLNNARQTSTKSRRRH